MWTRDVELNSPPPHQHFPGPACTRPLPRHTQGGAFETGQDVFVLLASGQWAMAKVIAVEANGYSVECVTEKGPSQMAIPFDDAATQLSG